MLNAGIAALAGTLLACLLAQTIDSYWISLLPIILYLIYRHAPGRIIWIFIASFLWASLGVYWQIDHRLARELNNKRVTLVGEVLNIPKKTDDNASFLFKPDESIGYQQRLPRTIKLNWRFPPKQLQAGQLWKLTAKIKQPHGFQNPGGFDYERWLFVNGIDATGYVVKEPAPILVEKPGISLNHLRQLIVNRLQQLCSDCTYPGLIQALSIGFRGNMNQTVRLLLQQTGTAHLIAISGLHIGIIAGVFYWLGFQAWRLWFFQGRFNRRELALLLSWVAALGYSLLSGFELPAQRALIMLSVIFASLWLRLPVNLLNSLFAAVILVLLFSPLAVLSESFWLSFSALLIIAFGNLIIPQETSRWRQLVYIQLLFSVLFIPLSITIFNQLHPSSLVANLVAVPLVSLVIVPLNFFLMSLLWLPIDWLKPMYAWLDSLLVWLISFLQGLQSIGLQAQNLKALNPWQVGLITVFIILLLLPRGLIVKSSWLWLVALLFIWSHAPGSRPQLHIAVLDVGMGTSIVVDTPNHRLVYDFGPGNKQGYSLGSWVVQPYLQHRGLDHLDRLIISHSDQDHLGGLYAIQQQLEYAAVYSGTPKTVSERLPLPVTVRNCHEAKDWIWDGVRFSFLSSDKGLPASENNRSCVLRIEIGSQRILITGDIESRQEFQLLYRYKDEALRADILVAPHHGSLTSSSPAFVEAVQANAVIFTTGYLNRWGFPRPEVVKRYQNKGSEMYQTDQDGAILIECKETACKLQRWRELKPRLWY